MKKKEIAWEVDENGCWNCTSHSKNLQGYPLMRLNGIGHKTAISRVMYTKYYGPIPAGMVIRHKCDNPLCINPNHLEIGTQKDNIHDMIQRGRYKIPRGYKGELNNHAKLNEQAIRNIFAERKAGVTAKELSKEFGVHKSMIYGILRRKFWAHIVIEAM
jgi:hypothetical protein